MDKRINDIIFFRNFFYFLCGHVTWMWLWCAKMASSRPEVECPVMLQPVLQLSPVLGSFRYLLEASIAPPTDAWSTPKMKIQRDCVGTLSYRDVAQVLPRRTRQYFVWVPMIDVCLQIMFYSVNLIMYVIFRNLNKWVKLIRLSLTMFQNKSLSMN